MGTWIGKRPVGVVGAGMMGSGIAELLANAGIDVLVHDIVEGRAAKSIAAIGAAMENRVTAGRLDAGEARATLARLKPVDRLEDLAPAALVIEAVPENIEAKRGLLRKLEGIVAEDALLSTNTSSLSVTAIAAACARPQRVAGLHFFNPVMAMKIVEVVAGMRTDRHAVEALADLARRAGHRPVFAADTPGFIVNHAGRGYGNEALRLLSEGVAPVETLDAILRDGAGFRMGPFELLDLIGLDVSHSGTETIYGQFSHEPRFRPSLITRSRLEAGLIGRRTGEGFYRYENGRKIVPEAAAPRPTGGGPATVRMVARPGAGLMPPLIEAAGARPGEDGLIVVPLIGEDLSTAVARLSLDARRTVGFDPLFGWHTHRTVLVSPATDEPSREAAERLFGADGVRASVVADSPGTVAQRIVATIINISCEMVQMSIATPDDIDEALRLVLGFPQGPLEWGDALGIQTVMRILEALQATTGDPRYRPSLYLRRRALLGLPLRPR